MTDRQAKWTGIAAARRIYIAAEQDRNDRFVIYAPYIPLLVTPPITRWQARWMRFRYLLWAPVRMVRVRIEDWRYRRWQRNRRFIVYYPHSVL